MKPIQWIPANRFHLVIAAAAAIASCVSPSLRADSTPHELQSGPFAQNWSNTNLITVSDDWSGVPSIVGYRGDNLSSSTGVDPQTILADGTATPVDVNANVVNPDTFTTGGAAEFDSITDPAVALTGSGTADAPFLLLAVNSTGMKSIRVRYNLRDLDGSADNAVQPVALQYRVGSSGDFTNVPAAFVADATTGPSLATLVTPVDVILPADADNQPLVQIRIITSNAVGNDEWVGVDDVLIGAEPLSSATDRIVGLARDGDAFQVTSESRTGHVYRLAMVDNLLSTNWVGVGSGVAGTGNPLVFTDNTVSGAVFRAWRIDIDPP